MLAPFLALAAKDLKLFFRNRRALLMTVAAPIVIGSFFGYIFGGAPAEPSRIPVLVVDRDGSAVSRAIAAGLTADKSLAVKPAALEPAREAVRNGKATTALVIPAGFGAEAGRAFFDNAAARPEIAVLFDPSHATETGMVEGILTGHVMEAVSKEMFNGPSGREMVKDTLAQLEASTLPAGEKASLRELLHGLDGWNAARDADAAAGRTPPSAGMMRVPYEVKTEPVTSGAGVEYNGYAHSFGGMGIQFILFLGVEVGVGLLLQRRTGVWQRLRAAPLSRAVVLGSRAASAALTSMFVMLALFAFAGAVFGVRIAGSVVGFLGVCAAFSLMTAAWGLLIAALGRTPEATRGLAIVTTLFMVMLGGAWVPTFVFPAWLQRLTVVIPTRWAMDGLDATTWRGLGFAAAALPIALLTGCALVFGALAVLRFRWEGEG